MAANRNFELLTTVRRLLQNRLLCGRGGYKNRNMKWIKNFKQYRKWVKQNDYYQHIKGSIIQYKIIGFNWFSGKIIFRYNNYGIFGIVEGNAVDFTAGSHAA